MTIDERAEFFSVCLPFFRTLPDAVRAELGQIRAQLGAGLVLQVPGGREYTHLQIVGVGARFQHFGVVVRLHDDVITPEQSLRYLAGKMPYVGSDTDTHRLITLGVLDPVAEAGARVVTNAKCPYTDPVLVESLALAYPHAPRHVNARVRHGIGAERMHVQSHAGVFLTQNAQSRGMIRVLVSDIDRADVFYIGADRGERRADRLGVFSCVDEQLVFTEPEIVAVSR